MTGSLLIAGVRTPFGRFGGGLAAVDAPTLGAHVTVAALEAASVPPERVDHVVMGNTVGTDKVVARQVSLLAGLAPVVTSLTVDRACCSAMAAVSLVDDGIRLGRLGIAVAGGTESMSLVPHLLHGARTSMRLGAGTIEDPLLLADPTTGRPAALDAGEVAVVHGVDRAEQDEWALRSQARHNDAQARGFYDGELAPVPGTPLVADEQPRPDTTLEGLAALGTVFGSPTVTAGNAPGLNDGAVAVVVASPVAAAELGLSPVARIVATASVAGPSRNIATIPADAITAVLQATGWSLNDVDLLEVNEAFAAVPPTTATLLAVTGPERAKLLDRTNVNGGAVAIGHPVGATGARLVLTLARALRERGGGRGVAAICGASGQGDAVALEVTA